MTYYPAHGSKYLESIAKKSPLGINYGYEMVDFYDTLGKIDKFFDNLEHFSFKTSLSKDAISHLEFLVNLHTTHGGIKISMTLDEITSYISFKKEYTSDEIPRY